jgi:hypothetical protein
MNRDIRELAALLVPRIEHAGYLARDVTADDDEIALATVAASIEALAEIWMPGEGLIINGAQLRELAERLNPFSG